MSEASEKFNDLPFDQRVMLIRLMLEAEIRFIEAEKKRMLADFKRSTREINARLRHMRQALDKPVKEVQQ